MLTEEQQTVVEAVRHSDGQNIIAVNAIGGSGKTHTSKAIVEAIKPKNGFYTAYNRAIVKDSASKFGNLIDCKTIHSLAWNYLKPSLKVKDLDVKDIEENLTYSEKQQIVNLLDNFCRSDSLDIIKFAKKNENICPDYLWKYAVKKIERMANNKDAMSFDFMLKCMHFDLANGTKMQRDLLILDECQDTMGVTLELFKLINADRKVILGDMRQNIYDFNNTVNAFKSLDNLETYSLTKSFRCNEEVASIVEEFGQKHFSPSFKFTGNSEVKCPKEPTTGFLYRTNSSMIVDMANFIEDNTSFSYIRPINEIFAVPLSLVQAENEKTIYDRRYFFLKELKDESIEANYKTLYEYILDNFDEDSNLVTAVYSLKKLSAKRINIWDVREKVSKLKQDKSRVVTTAHAAKGLEYDFVVLDDDLNQYVKRGIKRGNESELNTYYVALSRARIGVSNVDYNISSY